MPNVFPNGDEYDDLAKQVLGKKVPTAAPANYDDLIEKHSAANGVDPNLMRAIMGHESGGKPNAVSPKGARGLMQLMPGTAARFNVRNIHDPSENISGGAKYLKFLSDEFKGNTDLILAGYNAGEGAVKKYGNKIPPYRETQRYVPAVKARYTKLTGQPPQTPASPTPSSNPYDDIAREVLGRAPQATPQAPTTASPAAVSPPAPQRPSTADQSYLTDDQKRQVLAGKVPPRNAAAITTPPVASGAPAVIAPDYVPPAGPVVADPNDTPSWGTPEERAQMAAAQDQYSVVDTGANRMMAQIQGQRQQAIKQRAAQRAQQAQRQARERAQRAQQQTIDAGEGYSESVIPNTAGAGFVRNPVGRPGSDLARVLGQRYYGITEEPKPAPEINLSPQTRLGIPTMASRLAQQRVGQRPVTTAETSQAETESETARIRQEVLAERAQREKSAFSSGDPQGLAAYARSREPATAVEDEVARRLKESQEQRATQQAKWESMTPAEKNDFTVNVKKLSDKIRDNPDWWKGPRVGIAETSVRLLRTAGGMLSATAGVDMVTGREIESPAQQLSRKLLTRADQLQQAVDTLRGSEPLSMKQEAGAFIASSIGDLAQVIPFVETGGPIAGFATMGAASAAGQGASKKQIAETAIEQGLIGGGFKLAGKFAPKAGASFRQRLLSAGKQAGTVALATGGVELGAGATLGQAGQAMLTNALYAGGPTALGAVGAIGQKGRIERAGIARQTEIDRQGIRNKFDKILVRQGLDDVQRQEIRDELDKITIGKTFDEIDSQGIRNEFDKILVRQGLDDVQRAEIHKTLFPESAAPAEAAILPAEPSAPGAATEATTAPLAAGDQAAQKRAERKVLLAAETRKGGLPNDTASTLTAEATPTQAAEGATVPSAPTESTSAPSQSVEQGSSVARIGLGSKGQGDTVVIRDERGVVAGTDASIAERLIDKKISQSKTTEQLAGKLSVLGYSVGRNWHHQNAFVDFAQARIDGKTTQTFAEWRKPVLEAGSPSLQIELPPHMDTQPVSPEVAQGGAAPPESAPSTAATRRAERAARLAAAETPTTQPQPGAAPPSRKTPSVRPEATETPRAATPELQKYADQAAWVRAKLTPELTKVEQVAIKRKAARLEAKARGEKLMHMGADPYELIDDIIIRGGELIREGKASFGEWSRKMREELGEDADPHLRGIYAQLTGKSEGETAAPRAGIIAEGGAESSPLKFAEQAENKGYMNWGEDVPQGPVKPRAQTQAEADALIAEKGAANLANELIAIPDDAWISEAQVRATEQVMKELMDSPGGADLAMKLNRNIAAKLRLRGRVIEAAKLTDRLGGQGTVAAAERDLQANKRNPEAKLATEDAKKLFDAAEEARKLQEESDALHTNISGIREAEPAKYDRAVKLADRKTGGWRGELLTWANSAQAEAEATLEKFGYSLKGPSKGQAGKVLGPAADEMTALVKYYTARMAKGLVNRTEFIEDATELLKRNGVKLKAGVDSLFRRVSGEFTSRQVEMRRRAEINQVTDGRPNDFTPEQISALLEARKRQIRGQKQDRQIIAREARAAKIMEPGEEPAAFSPEHVRALRELAKSYVAQGLTDRADILRRVMNDIHEALPDVTKEQVRDAISRVGITAEMSQEPVDVAFREVNRQWRADAGLEAVQGGELPLRTGLQRDAISDTMRDLTRQIRELIRERGLTSAPTDEAHQKSQLDGIKTRLRNEIVDINRQLTKGEVDQKSTKTVTWDDEARHLKAHRDALRGALRELEAATGVADAKANARVLQSLTRANDILEQRIKSGDIASAAAKNDVSRWTAAIGKERQRHARLMSELNALRKTQRDALGKQSTVDQEKEIQKQIKALEKSIAEYQELINGVPKPRTEGPRPSEITSPQIEKLAAERKTLKGIVADQARIERSRLRTLRVPDVIRRINESASSDLAKQGAALFEANPGQALHEWEAQMAKYGLNLDDHAALKSTFTESYNLWQGARKSLSWEKTQARLLKAHAITPNEMADKILEQKSKQQDAAKARAERERLYNKLTMTGMQKAGHVAMEIAQIPVSLIFGGDVSYIGRQGGKIATGDWSKANLNVTGRMLKATRGVADVAYFNKKVEEIRGGKNYGLSLKSGLEQTTLATTDPFAEITMREEAAPARILNKVPIIGHYFRASERGFSLPADIQRFATFDRLAQIQIDRGVDPLKHPEVFEDIAKVINVLTLRASKGAILKAMGPWAGALGPVSPRALKARFQQVQYLTQLDRLTPPARKYVTRTLVQSYGAKIALMGLVYGAGRATGHNVSVTLNPDDPDFGKLKAGNARYDLFEGDSVTGRYIFRMMRLLYRTKTGEEREDPIKVTTDFLSKKESPMPATVLAMISGRGPTGERFRYRDLPKNLLVPAVARDITEAIQLDGWVGGAKALPTFIGIGVQTYKDDASPAVKFLRQRSRMGYGIPSDEELDAMGVRKSIREKFATSPGDAAAMMDKAIEAGEMTREGKRKLLQSLNLGELRSRTKSASMNTALDAFEKMTPAERAEVKPELIKKGEYPSFPKMPERERKILYPRWRKAIGAGAP